MPIHRPHTEQRTNAPTHQPRDIRTPPPALRHSDIAMAEPAAPRKTRPRSPTLDEAHEVIRALGLRDGEGDPPQEDAGADSDLEALPEPPAGGAPAEPAPPAGSVSAICPAWKRGHCTGEGWCPRQHPQPDADDGALPEVKPAAARAALRYGVTQGWILDETARGSVNIQEAVDRVTHAGQAAVALHTRGRHGGPAEGIIVDPSGMVLVLAADMARGVLHVSRVRRACPQWTIQVYTPPRAWPFSTWAVLAVMWHLAPEDAPTGTAEDIARDLHTWPADQEYPWRRPRGGLPVAPAAEGLSLAATLQRHPDKYARHFLQTGTVPAAPPDSEWRWDAGVAQPLPGPWTLPLWYLPMGTLAHATQAVKGAFPQPPLPGVALLRSLQAGAAWVRWREGKGRSSPYFPMVQGQALIHAEGMGTVEWGAIVPGTACRWITAAAPQPMRSPPACHRLLRMVPSLAPQHAFTRDVWKAVLSHTREWLTNPGTRYPPGPVLEQLTAPTPGVLHALHRASALTKQLNDEVLDLALEPLRVLYPQAHIPPAGTSNRLGRLGLQRRVEAAHPGGVVEQWLTLRNPSAAEGHWYLHQLLFQPRAAPEHRRQDPYHTHPERRGAQNYPQPIPPALPPGQGPEALQRGPPLDTATTVQQWGGDDASGAEPDCTNCGAVAWMAACRHLTRDTTGLRQYRPTDRTALASAVAAVTMGPVAAWPAQLLPHVPCRDTRPRRPAATHEPTAPLTAEQLYVVAAALLADGKERASSTTTARRKLRDAYKGPSAMHQTRGMPHSAGAPASGVRAMAHPRPGLSRGRRWYCRRQDTKPSYTATPEGTGRTSWPEADGRSGTAPPGKGHSRPCPTPTGDRGPPRPTTCRRTPGRWRSCCTRSAPPTRGRNRGGSTPPHWCGAPTRRSIYGPRGRETPSGPQTSRTSTRGPSRTPAQRLPWRWPNGGSRTHSGWSACSPRRTRTSSSATLNACRGPKP